MLIPLSVQRVTSDVEGTAASDTSEDGSGPSTAAGAVGLGVLSGCLSLIGDNRHKPHSGPPQRDSDPQRLPQLTSRDSRPRSKRFGIKPEASASLQVKCCAAAS